VPDRPDQNLPPVIAPPNVQTAVAAIAADAIHLGIHRRLPTNVEYQTRLGVGSGTVQQALRALQAAGALETVSRGHQGRHVVRLDMGRLWSLGQLPPARLIAPPPGPVELYGLLDALQEHFGALGVPHNVVHRRGGRARVEAVRAADADAAILSSAAARELVGTDPELAIEDLGENTYYAPNTVVVLRRPGAPQRAGPLRVGIDHASHDHVRLTEAEFPAGAGIQHIPCHFPTMPVVVLEGRVDAGIWHRLVLLISPELAGVEVAPLRTANGLAMRRRLSAAAFVITTRRPELVAILRSLDLALLQAHQLELLRLDARSITPAGK